MKKHLPRPSEPAAAPTSMGMSAKLSVPVLAAADSGGRDFCARSRDGVASDFQLAPCAAVRRFARINPWIDRRDLEQEAALAALEARSSWREGGVAPDSWEARMMARRLSRFVAENLSPVSLPPGTRSWEVARRSRSTSDDADVFDRVATDRIDEHRLDRQRMAAKVRQILDEESEAARAVLLADEAEAEGPGRPPISARVAEKLGLTRRQVYRQTEEAMRALRDAFRSEMEPA